MGRPDGDNYWLTQEEIDSYHRDGYVKLNGVLTNEELGPIERVFEEFIQGKVSNMGRDFCDMSGQYGTKFEEFNLVNAVLPRKYRPQLVGNIYERRATSIARQLIGNDVLLDYDQFLAKRPNKPTASFAMHQDLGYWPLTPDTKTTTCSLALDDADKSNGCLRVVPGTHLEKTLRRHRPKLGDREQSHTLCIDLKETDRVILLPVKRGDITVHNERIVHGSGGNHSERWRRTYVVAHRSKSCVEFERSIGFTHSHNDTVNWSTHLESLERKQSQL
uniref:Phytanoyl-CoA dioxygenase n=1 Tax=Mucochytrium quahogii TaxID=96639 RepID=A0A7S2S1V4_9STRA|mmetsp:Transcript_6679/g.10532  ORF Transcript_6679/g.10532 Transcript_6679/m.10532 type:complete len:275 (+) Transcript_6679:155-979(+)